MSLLIRTTVLLDQGPILMTSFSLNYFLIDLSPNALTLGGRPSTYEFGEKSIQSIALLYGHLHRHLYG